MVEESTTRFVRPKRGLSESSPNLYVANCGPAVGLSLDQIALAFGEFGQVRGVRAADGTGTRVIVSFVQDSSAQEALEALDGNPCPNLGGRLLHIRYSMLQPLPFQVNGFVSVSLEASQLQIPGIHLMQDFITSREEEELLAAVDGMPWKNLAKRRVQHYGYEFFYETRNVDTRCHLGEIPSFLSPILRRISSFPEAENIVLDQLTVNEYPAGVGLSPHIDTHSAFEGCIFSLSLAGPCIMEFRRYSDAGVMRKAALFLPARSMLLLSGEGRYAWHHYIPHHKVDVVGGDVIKRASRRVSLTIRKVRNGACCCDFPQYCDSQIRPHDCLN